MKAAAEFLVRGGPVMAPLLLCSVMALAVIITQLWSWARLGPTADADRVLAAAGRGDWREAVRAAQASRSPVARVLGAGLTHGNAALAMETAAQDELARLRRYLPVLDTVITLSPLLGLLGTVTGMIGAFGVMAQAGLNQPTAITGGVAEALIATAAGLAIAIVALVPYNLFQSRTERMAATMERYGSRLELTMADASGRSRDGGPACPAFEVPVDALS